VSLMPILMPIVWFRTGVRTGVARTRFRPPNHKVIRRPATRPDTPRTGVLIPVVTPF
jgi:hypothetical protein